MKKTILLSALLVAMPLSMMAQDDLYFVPTKKAVQEAKKDYYRQNGYDDYSYSGSTRSVDEYNRRGGSYYEDIPDSSDVIDFSGEMGVYPDSADMGGDYQLTRQMARWDGYTPTDAYWEGYDRGRSDEWAVSSWHSPWYYSSYYPWYDSYWYDPWYYGHYGWGLSWSWGWRYPYSYYSSWYYPGYYHHYGYYRPYYGGSAYTVRGHRYYRPGSRSSSTAAGRRTSGGGTTYSRGTFGRSSAGTTRGSFGSRSGNTVGTSSNTRSSSASSGSFGRSSGGTFGSRSSSSSSSSSARSSISSSSSSRSSSSGSFGRSSGGSFGGSSGGTRSGGGSFGGSSGGGRSGGGSFGRR